MRKFLSSCMLGRETDRPTTAPCITRRRWRMGEKVVCDNFKGNKSVFSFLRQLSTRHCPHVLLQSAVCCWAPCCGAAAAECRRLQQSIDMSRPPGAQQQTRRTPVLRSIDGTNIRTDGRTLDRFTDLAPQSAYYADSVSGRRRRRRRCR